jgi:hypothetical protein
MNSKAKKRRIINIDKDDFDTIKEYCDEHSLNMPKWMAKLAITTILGGYKSLNETYTTTNKLPLITDIVKKQLLANPEKFEKYLKTVNKSNNIKG